MSALKDGMVEITLDRPRKLLFDLNAIEALEDKYGGYDKLVEILSPENPKYISDIKYIMTLLLNEAAEYQNYLAGDEVEKPITEKVLGMIVNASILTSGETTSAIFSAFNIGTAGKAKAEPDDEGPMKAATATSTM
jgi:hypothetical protein